MKDNQPEVWPRRREDTRTRPIVPHRIDKEALGQEHFRRPFLFNAKLPLGRTGSIH